MKRALLVTVLVLLPSFADAGLIIDDFTAPALVVSPEQERLSIVTENVGPLAGERHLEIVGIIADPVARIDVSNSDALLVMEDVAWTDDRIRPIVAQHIKYEGFGAADLTRYGNSFLLDFLSVEGPILPRELLILLRNPRFPDDGTPYWYSAKPIFESTEPFTLRFPFSEFIARAGGAPAPPLTNTTNLSFSFRTGRQIDSEYTIRLDAIRIGVPEPPTAGLILFAMVLFAGGRGCYAICRSGRGGPH